jgi:cytochrome c
MTVITTTTVPTTPITKRFAVAVFIVLCSILVISGCSDKSDDRQSAPATQDQDTTTTPAPNAQTEEQATAEPEQPPATTSPETGTEQEATQTAGTEPAPAVAEPATTPPAETQTTAAGTADQGDMLALARKSGCLACHSVDKKIVGPAWKDVSKRYAGKADIRSQLIEKVSKGGRGNWTEVVGNVAMPPYHPRVSKENISKLVDFVLSLAKS